MKNITKIVSLGLASVSLLSLAACGGGTTKQRGDREIIFEYLDAGFGDEPYVAVAEAFMAKYPEITVTLCPNRELTGTLNNSLSSNTNVSDIYSYQYSSGLRTWITNGYVEDLTALCDTEIPGDGRTVRQSMIGNTEECMKLDGKIYAVPEYTNVTGFIYNMDLFEQYGWKVPNNTKEFEALCKQIIKDTKGAVDPIIWCRDADGYLYFASENWITQYAGVANMDKFYEYNSKEIYALQDNDAGSLYSAKVAALENLVKFLVPEGDYTYDNSRTEDYMKAQLKVITGECAMMLNGAWFENEMSKELSLPEYKDTKIGMFAVPEIADTNGEPIHMDGYTTVDAEGKVATEGKRVINASHGAYYFIPSMAKNKEDAKTFFLYLNSKEACEIYTKHANVVRPFDYDYGEGSSVYNEVSVFGKSVLKMADEHYLYAPASNSPLDWLSVAGLWPQGNRVERQILSDSSLTINADEWLQKDYNFANKMWDTWQGLLK